MGLIDLLVRRKKKDTDTRVSTEPKAKIPIFNLDIREKLPPIEKLRNPEYLHNFNLFQEGLYTVFSNGSISEGSNDSLCTYAAELIRRSNGLPADIEFNRGRGIPEYPYRVLGDGHFVKSKWRGYHYIQAWKLTALSIGDDAEKFESEPHFRVA